MIPCEFDTNSDGNCGRKTCVRCHPEYQPMPTMTVRLGDGERAAVEGRADAEGVQRSVMLRRLLAYAEANMPKGWRP